MHRNLTAKVISVGLHLREGPSVSYDEITAVSFGDRLELLGEIHPNGWVEVRVIWTRNSIQVGVRGWVNSANITVEVPQPDAPAPEPCAPTESLIPAHVVVAAIGVAIIFSVLWLVWWRPLVNVVYP